MQHPPPCTSARLGAHDAPFRALIRGRAGFRRLGQLGPDGSSRRGARWGRSRPAAPAVRASAGAGSPPPAAGKGLFPAGKRQARVTIPALFLTASAEELAGSPAALEELGAAVAGGATAVVLYEGAAGGASQLYEAALQVRELLRGRAALLIADRTDIAPAAEADGALLSPQACGAGRGGAPLRCSPTLAWAWSTWPLQFVPCVGGAATTLQTGA